MPGFVAIATGRDGDEPARRAIVAAIVRRLPGMARIDAAGLTLLVAAGPRALPCQRNAAGTLLLVGELFERGASGTAPSRPARIDDWADAPPQTLARRLVAERWGRYVAFVARTGDVPRLLRDPSGAIAAVLIEGEAASVASDLMPRWLHELVRGPVRIAWDAVAAQLDDPTIVTHTALLHGVTVAIPGTLLPMTGDEASYRVWTPATNARTTRPMDAIAERLRFTVADTARTLAGPGQSLLELSGGLDSSILLACLAPGGPPVCVNVATGFPGGDERRFARAAADLAGANLVEVLLDPAEMAFDARSPISATMQALSSMAATSRTNG